MKDSNEPHYTAKQYESALRAVALAPHHQRMLQAHYCAPKRTLTATQMSKALGYKASHGPANMHYGKLAKMLGEHLSWEPLPDPFVTTLCTFEKPGKEWLWIMRPAVAAALENLGWVSDFKMPDEVETEAVHYEGAIKSVTVNKYERNVEAREKCISHYGCKCFACGLVLQDKYGEEAQGFIQVHHLKALADVGAEYKVDPINDLRPVCPTCHAVIHLRKPGYSIEEIQSMLAKATKTLANKTK